jgi:hypothetical protein
MTAVLGWQAPGWLFGLAAGLVAALYLTAWLLVRHVRLRGSVRPELIYMRPAPMRAPSQRMDRPHRPDASTASAPERHFEAVTRS